MQNGNMIFKNKTDEMCLRGGWVVREDFAAVIRKENIG